MPETIAYFELVTAAGVRAWGPASRELCERRLAMPGSKGLSVREVPRSGLELRPYSVHWARDRSDEWHVLATDETEAVRAVRDRLTEVPGLGIIARLDTSLAHRFGSETGDVLPGPLNQPALIRQYLRDNLRVRVDHSHEYAYGGGTEINIRVTLLLDGEEISSDMAPVPNFHTNQ